MLWDSLGEDKTTSPVADGRGGEVVVLEGTTAIRSLGEVSFPSSRLLGLGFREMLGLAPVRRRQATALVSSRIAAAARDSAQAARSLACGRHPSRETVGPGGPHRKGPRTARVSAQPRGCELEGGVRGLRAVRDST